MKKLITFFAAYVVLTSTAQVSIDTTDKFSDVKNYVDLLLEQNDKSEILIVLDIDNTILTSQTDLGGDIWYQWQTDSLDIKPTADQKIGDQIFDVVGILYELGTMQLTDPVVKNHIDSWQEKGIATFALTSRAPNARGATERELDKRDIRFNKTALGKLSGDTIILFKQGKKYVSYINGIMMTTGIDKGVMLDTLMYMTKTKESFKHIIFVDDTRKNVINVKNRFEDKHSIHVKIFYYTKIESDREKKYGAILTQEQADKMAREWEALRGVVNWIFPERLKK